MKILIVRLEALQSLRAGGVLGRLRSIIGTHTRERLWEEDAIM